MSDERVHPRITPARWFARDGAIVRPGDRVCEIETDNASVEMEAGTDGRLLRLKQEGEPVSAVDPPFQIVPFATRA